MPRITPHSSFPRRRLFALAAAIGFAIASQIAAKAITIQLDYSYDSGSFFGPATPERARLLDAASFFENLLTDDLDAITPTGEFSSFTPESWQITFDNPSNGDPESIDDISIPADTIILYVGGQSFGGAKLAEAGPGGYNSLVYEDSEFDMAVKTRGETGVGTTDFAPWGGTLSVDDATAWDTSLLGDAEPAGDQHLYSTLLHEIGHVFGLGTAASWDSQITSGEFTGTSSVAEFGGNVPLYSPQFEHWDAGTMSVIYNTTTAQEAALDPNITAGAVKLFTDLDVAGLDDIGWDIAAPVPEPTGTALMALLAGSLCLRRRR